LRNGTAISGATSSSYLITAADAGAKITVEITGSHSDYQSYTFTSGAIVPEDVAINNLTPPAITGDAKVGNTLGATVGTWSVTGLAYQYQWLVGGAVKGTSTSYLLTAADLGKSLQLRVIAWKSGYTSVSASSSTVTVQPAPVQVTLKKFSKTGTPTLSGTAKVGSTVKVKSKGSWSPKPASYGYQWYANGVEISGAVNSSLKLTADQNGKQVTLKLIGKKSGYADTLSKASKAKKVAAGSLAAKTPKITNSSTGKDPAKTAPKFGDTLSTSVSAWTPAPVQLGYQWYRSGKAISGFTDSTYTIVAADIGKTISVKVTGTKPGYKTASKTAKASKKVVALKFSATAKPQLVGVPGVGVTLTINTGTWTPAPTPPFKYQWLRDGKAIKDATGASYLTVGADRGKSISVKLTGSRTGYASVTQTSAKVKIGVLTTKTPKIVNLTTKKDPVKTAARVGQVLAVSVSAWTPAPVALGYQWYRSGKAITEANGATYTLVTADLGKTISVKVTGTKLGYDFTPAASTSKAIKKVAK
jgi:hypothetical protein